MQTWPHNTTWIWREENTWLPVKREQQMEKKKNPTKLLVPESSGTLYDVITDHWKQETPVYHYLLLITACFVIVVCFVFDHFFFLQTCRRCTFKEVLLAQHCYSTGNWNKTIPYKYVSMYTSLSIFFIYKKKKKKQKKVLEITCGLSSGSLLFHALDILQKCYFLILHCNLFVQLNRVINGYHYFWPKFSADTSTNALREKKKHLNAVLLIFYW